MWALYVNSGGTYFHRLGVEYIPKKNRKLIGNRNITVNIFRIQAFNNV